MIPEMEGYYWIRHDPSMGREVMYVSCGLPPLPQPAPPKPEVREEAKGPPILTKREHFAMAAMEGILAEGDYTRIPIIVTTAVSIADALIAELAKPKLE